MRKTVMFMALLLCVHPLKACSDGKPSSEKVIEMHWSELESITTRGRIEIVFPDGVHIRGRAVAVERDALVMEVLKSSDKSAYPKGRRSIPRSEVTTIAHTRWKGIAGPALVVGGVVGGMMLVGVYALTTGSGEGPSTKEAAAGWGILAGGTAAGYYGGRAVGRKKTLIKVLAD